MTQRFSEKINERNVVINGINSTIGIHGRYFIGAAIDKLSEYETAEEEGRMVVLPCSPKDTLYFLVDDCNYAYDCGQKLTCNKCEYRDLHMEEDTLSKTGIVLSFWNYLVKRYFLPVKKQRKYWRR